MTEDFDLDSDLAGMLDEAGDGDPLEAGGDDSGDDAGMDLGDLDLDALGGGAAEDTEGGGLGDLDLDALGGGAADASGGDDAGFDMDAEMSAMMKEGGGDSAGGDEADSGGGDGGGFDMDAEMASMMDESRGGGGGAGAPALDGGGSAPAFDPARVAGLSKSQAVNLDFLLDIKLHVTFEVGRAKMVVSDLLTLGQGSVIELHRLVGDDLDMLVNGRLIAKGEVVVLNEKFGCKINLIIPPEERVKHLSGY